MKQQASSQYNAHTNRQKLIQQNTKLNKQIHSLQEKISLLITMDVSQAVQAQQNKNNEASSNKKGKFSQIVVQENYIKKLKAKIKELKSVSMTGVMHGVIDQENQLKCMKKQYQILCNEKKTIILKCLDKSKALQYNNPLHQYKNDTNYQLLKIKKVNADMSTKIVQLQRQIRKLHRYQQMHKKYKDEKISINNPQYQFQLTKIQHQRIAVIKKSKTVQQKWRPQIQGLDKLYFQVKEQLVKKQKDLDLLQKELKNWQNRASAVRDQSDVVQDRERISKVITLSSKKQKIQQKSPAKNIDNKKQMGFADFFKNLFTKKSQQKQKLDLSPKKPQKQKSPQQKQHPKLDDKQPQLRKWNNLAAQTRYCTQSQHVKPGNQTKYDFAKLSQKNQFMNSKHSFEGFDLNLKNMNKNSLNNNGIELNDQQKLEIKKNKIITNSVAVGTSFYYNQDD